MMESDPILRNTEKWYDMTREEQMENHFKRAKKVHEIARAKYFTNYEVDYITWFQQVFQGIVIIYLLNFFKVSIRFDIQHVLSCHQRTWRRLTKCSLVITYKRPQDRWMLCLN